jgi:diadenosine tetraphosphate (Ap4A) HIT family hydrolase
VSGCCNKSIYKTIDKELYDMKLYIDDEFIDKFRLNDYLLKAIGSWLISVRPQQPTIGCLVLSLNRSCDKLGNIDEQEGIDLVHAFTEVERILYASFMPNKINYLSLMMIDEQVHFHVIPRYKESVYVLGTEYQDRSWPLYPSLEPLKMNESTMEEIIKILKGQN